MDLAEDALTLQAHQMAVIGWQSRAEFKNRVWPVQANHENISVETFVETTCPFDENSVFKEIACEATVQVFNQRFRFAQTFEFIENSSALDLKFKLGPIKFISKDQSDSRKSGFNINEILPPHLVNLTKSEGNINKWGETLSQVIKDKSSEPFHQYLSCYGILKTVEMVENLELFEAISLIKSTNLIKRLEFSGLNYMELSPSAIQIELESLDFANESEDFKSFIKESLLEQAQEKLVSIPAHLVKNQAFLELVEICKQMISSDRALKASREFNKLVEKIPEFLPRIARTTESNSFQKLAMKNMSHALYAYIWNDQLNYLDTNGDLWSMTYNMNEWKKVGQVPSKPDPNSRLVKTIDGEFNFDILAFYHKKQLWLSEDGATWNANDLPESIEDLKNLHISPAIGGGLVLIHETQVWVTSDFIDWNKISDLPFNGKYGRLIHYNNMYFHYGGCNNESVDSCHNYVASSKDLTSWKERSPALFSPKKEPAVWSDGESILIHGGIQKISNSKIYSSFNGIQFETLLSPNLLNLSQHFLIKFNHKIFIVGGKTDQNKGCPFIFRERYQVMQSLSSCGLRAFYTFKTFRI